MDPKLNDLTADMTVDERRTAPSAGPRMERGASIGRYVVLAPLGEGGMGVVYKAYDPELDRPVAVKLLHTERGDAELAARERLLREAQGLARLSHPNVVAVHDVGTLGESVFIAMEFVAGQTLRSWLLRAERSQKEILSAFLAAGEGLKAAHEAGLVHRDFKPDNVIVGDDGRVRVLDFGLVRNVEANLAESLETSRERLLTRDETDLPDNDTQIASVSGSTGRLSAPLTQAGAIMGTPHFMAPEQHEGRATDARADQFSFCVALFHALYGHWPFPAATLSQLKRRVLAGKVAEPSTSSRVPSFLRKALLRGLSVDPEARFASMAELLHALRSDPSIRRRQWTIGSVAVTALVMLGAALGVLRGSGARVCAGGEDRLRGVWDDGQRAAVQRAFRATSSPFAEAALGTVERAFDQYARAWSDMREEACEATHVRGEQSQELLDLRMACLDDRLTQLKTLSTAYASDAKSLVSRAAESVQSLPTLAACADTTALKAPIRPPRDARVQKRVEHVRSELSRAKALGLLARYDDGTKGARAALHEAEQLHYAPVEAEAQLALGVLLDERGEYEAATHALERAFVLSLGGQHDEASTLAAIHLLLTVGSRQGHYAEGDRWSDIADALVTRMRGRPDLLGTFHLHRAMLREREGKYDGALSDVRAALSLAERQHGREHGSLNTIYHMLGNIHYQKAEYKEALAAYQRSYEIAERTLGEAHPKVIANLVGMADVYGESGDRTRPLPMYQKALAAIQRVQLDHPYVPVISNNMAEELLLLSRPAEALPLFQRAYDLWKQQGDAAYETTSAQRGLGRARLALGDSQGALRDLLAAMELCTSGLGAEHELCGETSGFMGEAYERLGKTSDARSAYQHALAVLEKALDANHPSLVGPLLGVGRTELALGSSAHARVALSRALALCEARPEAQCDRAEVRLLLGKAL